MRTRVEVNLAFLLEDLMEIDMLKNDADRNPIKAELALTD